MRKDYISVGDKVVRPYKDTFLYGTVVELHPMSVDFKTPEGFIFRSDIGHLEVVNNGSSAKSMDAA